MSYMSHRSLSSAVSFGDAPKAQFSLANLFSAWRHRAKERAELARMSERELQDIGLTRLDAVREYQKPFWRL